jgi:poly-gamma-glutamate synthesis protein (capsule biosynthesis protein)
MKIGIIGDLCLSHANTSVNINQILEDFSKSNILQELKKNDFNVINLEAPITDSKSPIIKTGPNLTNPKEVIDILKLMDTQICTLANNHIFDYGFEGLNDTIDICKQNDIKTVGAGLEHSKIYEPLILEKEGVKVAIINFAENEFNTIDLYEKGAGSNNLDIIKIFHQISDVKSKSDYIILIGHGGHEQYHYPSPRIKKLYRFLIDFGADALIGHHPHVVQGYEIYKDKPIFYSIGNFFFPSIEKNIAKHEGFVVVLDLLKDKITHAILPYTQCIDNYRVDLMEGEQKSEFLDRLHSLSLTTMNDKELENKWREFLQKRKEVFISSLFPFNRKIVTRLLKYGLDRLFVPKKHFLRLMNLIRCESHRDILIMTMKEKYYK